jgi:hypothetical protein
MKVEYLGKEKFVFVHGDVREEFELGEVKEVSQYVGEELLRETQIKQKWNRKTGKLQSEETIFLFAKIDEIPPLPDDEADDLDDEAEDQTQGGDE